MKEKSFKTVLGGILSSLAVTIMLFGSIIPFATFAVPAIASICIFFFVIEYGVKFAVVVYVAISILSAFIVPDKELAFMFILFFGLFPIVKYFIESKLKPTTVQWIAKLIFCNASIALIYSLLLFVFVFPVIRQELEQYSNLMLVGLMVLGNITFILYDIAFTRLIYSYVNFYRKKFIRKL